jgi:hypothetical protein
LKQKLQALKPVKGNSPFTELVFLAQSCTFSCSQSQAFQAKPQQSSQSSKV